MLKLFVYELKNISRSRWILLLSILVFVLSLGMLRISGDSTKALLSVESVLILGAPLFAGLFSVVYWYHSDRYTQLVLTMPVFRGDLFIARWLALVVSLGGGVVLGVVGAFSILGTFSLGLLLGLALILFVIVTFVSFGLLVGIICGDRIKGIGCVLGVWLYFILIHDALLLAALAAFKEYPIELASAAFSALNPLGLVRVVFLMYHDAPLLLSQTGAIIRNTLTSQWAYGVGGAIACGWIVIPAWVARRAFIRNDL